VPDLTTSAVIDTPIPPAVKRPAGSRWSWAFLIDIAVFLFVFAGIFGVYAVGRSWLGPIRPHVEISQNPRDLPLYALYSLVRISVAYALSLVFALAYGYVAASSRRAEVFMVPLLDILQSIPVLSFLTIFITFFVSLFPGSLIGVECASVLTVFTGQVWNMAFGFYHSMVTIPQDLHEAATNYRLTALQRFQKLEVPASMHSLIWNCMMSFGAGWFAVSASEAITVLGKNIQLPGLGSYMATAVSTGDYWAAFWAIITMLSVILATDQLVWRPLLVCRSASLSFWKY